MSCRATVTRPRLDEHEPGASMDEPPAVFGPPITPPRGVGWLRATAEWAYALFALVVAGLAFGFGVRLVQVLWG